MNLITDACFPVMRRDGSIETIKISDIADHGPNPPMELALGRHDLRLAILELLIGLFTVAIRPQTNSGMLRLWKNRDKLTPAILDAEFTPIVYAFNVDGTGPRFMQDMERNPNPVWNANDPSMLWMDGALGKTIEDNFDFFVKRPRNGYLMSPAYAAFALYTLQAYAPSGGQGHRVGFRGGGPFTTLVIPERTSTLLEKILANIPIGPAVNHPGDHPTIFPWLVDTITSGPADKGLQVGDVHELQAFFAMPRRVVFNIRPNTGNEKCSMSGEVSGLVVDSFSFIKHGVDYSVCTIEHPLGSYYTEKNSTQRLPLHPDDKWKTWGGYLGLVQPDTKTDSAKSVQQAIKLRLFPDMQVIASGYDTSNTKVKAFVEYKLPVFQLDDINGSRDRLNDQIKRLVGSATFIKDCLMKEKVTREVIEKFWEETHHPFYEFASKIRDALVVDPDSESDWGGAWQEVLKIAFLKVFDESVPAARYQKMKKDSEGRNVFPIAVQRKHIQDALDSKKLKNILGIR